MIKAVLTSNNESIKPTVGTKGSAGYDLKLASNVVIEPGQVQKVSTGVKFQVPEGHFGMVVPRSSTGKKGLQLTNTIGIIDSDYQGEIFLEIRNVSRETFLGYVGDSLFQLCIIPCVMDTLVFVDSFDTTTDRGDGGFGSTDKKEPA